MVLTPINKLPQFNFSLVKGLLQKECLDINLRERYVPTANNNTGAGGRALLHYVTENQAFEGVFWLMLDHPELDVNVNDSEPNNHSTPLFNALRRHDHSSRNNLTGMIEALLANPEVDVNRANSNGQTPLWADLHNRYDPQALKWLLQRAELDLMKVKAN